MFKKATGLLLLLLSLQMSVEACQCMYIPDFCGTVANRQPDLIVKGVRVGGVAHGSQFLIEEVLYGAETQDTINVWGDTGALCRGGLGAYHTTDTLIIAIHYTDYMGNRMSFGGTPDLEETGDYLLSACGNFVLEAANDSVYARANSFIQNGNTSMARTDFDNMLNTSSCPVPAKLNIKVLLEGAYDTVSQKMKRDLNMSSLVPNQQPYNTVPWNYGGTELLSPLPTLAVDWVYVRLLDTTDPTVVVDEAVGLLYEDGRILGVDMQLPVWDNYYNSGASYTNTVWGLNFYQADPSKSYYIAIHHRNHLAAMSAIPVALKTVFPDSGNAQTKYHYDFTTGTSKAMFGLMHAIDIQTSALYAGDANGDGKIVLNDFNLFLGQVSSMFGYYGADFNMSTAVTIQDFNFFMSNMSLFAPVYLQY